MGPVGRRRGGTCWTEEGWLGEGGAWGVRMRHEMLTQRTFFAITCNTVLSQHFVTHVVPPRGGGGGGCVGWGLLGGERVGSVGWRTGGVCWVENGWGLLGGERVGSVGWRTGGVCWVENGWGLLGGERVGSVGWRTCGVCWVENGWGLLGGERVGSVGWRTGGVCWVENGWGLLGGERVGSVGWRTGGVCWVENGWGLLGGEQVGSVGCVLILFLLRSLDKVHHQASSIFCTQDLIGGRYVGVVLASLKQLWMITCSDDVTGGKPLRLASMTTISGCLKAISLSHLSMMLVLTEGGGVVLYSGLVKVGECEQS